MAEEDDDDDAEDADDAEGDDAGFGDDCNEVVALFGAVPTISLSKLKNDPIDNSNAEIKG